MDKLKKAELFEIIESTFDGTCDKAMQLRLEQLLRDDPEARDFYIEQCQLHSMLAWEHGTLVGCGIELDDQVSAKSRNRLLHRWRLVAAVASVLFLFSISWLVYQEFEKPNNINEQGIASESSVPESTVPWDERKIVAVVSQKQGAQLRATEFSINLDLDAEVRTGKFEITHGFVELTFKNGAKVVVESPSEFQIVSEMQMMMNRGRMSATISKEAEGFSVETPSISLVDYGTEFAVEVLESDSSEVHVFDGEVRVNPNFAPPTTGTVRLVSNQATRVRGKSGIPEGIDVDHSRFVRQLKEPVEGMGEYYDFVEARNPVTMFRMAPSDDGSTLTNHGSQRLNAVISAERMQSPPFKPGKIGSSLYFNGPEASAYASLMEYQPSTSGELTVCAWVRADSRTRWAAVAKHWSIEFPRMGEPIPLPNELPYKGLGGQFHFGLHEDDGDLELQVRQKDGEVIKLREEKPLPIGQWQHVAFVVGNGKVRLYRNGMEVGSAACAGLATDGPKGLGIGAKLNPDCTKPDLTNPGFWHGRIDELAIFHQVLSQDEIIRLYEFGNP
ncbi:MAG: LamG-like jellyroll fold domain-containing protein [Planctomycetota bacterium]